MIPRPLHLILTLALTALWAAVIWETLLWFGPNWAAYAPATCQPTCFCELPRTGDLLLHPANTLSSLGFVAVGGWIALPAVIMLGARSNRWKPFLRRGTPCEHRSFQQPKRWPSESTLG